MILKAQTRGKRGVILTSEGWEKLQTALQEWENQQNSAKPYTIEALSEITRLDPSTISKVLHRKVGVDKRTLQRFFNAFTLELNKSDYTNFSVINKTIESSEEQNKYFCTEAPDVSIFFGRSEEINILKRWIIDDCCRLITLVGIGGIGKTSLSAKVAENFSENFDCSIWFSLRNAPLPLEIISNLLQIISNGEETDLSKNITQIINKLLEYLQNKRLLLIFDNVDAVFCGGNYAGNYLQGYEGYGELFQKLGETFHQSCLLITSREKPKEIAAIEGKELPVRCLQIGGLGVGEVKEILKAKGITCGINSELEQLNINYGGNPLYIKVVANTILDLFDGNISNFIADSSTVFDGTKIVSGSSDRTIKIWNSQTGECLKTISGHNRPVLSVAFSGDGNTIASCGAHSIIKLWNVLTGECFQTIEERACYIIKLKYNLKLNSLILASGHTSGIVKLWDINNGKCIQTLGNFGKPIISMAFSHDGKFIAYGSYDGTVNVWNINNSKSMAILQKKSSSPWSIAFNTDSNLLAVGRDKENIQLWDINTGKIIKSFNS